MSLKTFWRNAWQYIGFLHFILKIKIYFQLVKDIFYLLTFKQTSNKKRKNWLGLHVLPAYTYRFYGSEKKNRQHQRLLNIR